MQQLLDSNLDLLITADSLYVPLRFDPSIAAELEAHPGWASSSGPGSEPMTSPLQVLAGKAYVKAMSLPSLVENYETIHPEAYEELRRTSLEKYRPAPTGPEISPDPKLSTIIFEILPHFIKMKEGRKPGAPLAGNILELIGRRLAIPPEYYRRAQELYSPESLHRQLRALADSPGPGGAPVEGRLPARDLKAWLRRVLAARIVARERDRLQRLLAEGEPYFTSRRQYLALQLYIAAAGGLEIDGCGFCHLRRHGEYLIYKRTGEYALKDYYGRIYRFPDCRVAVASQGRLKPVVLERYKHPLLYRYAPGQEICIRHYTPAAGFTAANVIQALEEGLSALYYGYNRRRRNGYHSLDRITEHYRSIDFADYVIPRDDPRIISGELEVTNAYT
jgi:hypothetical protein